MQAYRLLAMLLRERFSGARLARRPEPSATMDDESQVAAFHDQGATTLLPVYHFNALAASRMVPENGTLVDLGSGSGQYLAYLAECRPDMRIVGLELAPRMVSAGRKMLAQRGLLNRVELRQGDMTAFAADFNGAVDLVSSVFSLHHLPDECQLVACLGQIRALHQRTGCGVWVFDHVRPRHAATPDLFPALFTPEAPAAFNRDSSNSLTASFAFDELSRHMELAEWPVAEHWLSQWMKLYQVHCFGGRIQIQPSGTQGLWRAPVLPEIVRKNWAGLQRLFPDCPKHG